MTSVDAGSMSLQACSDEVYDHVCEPCRKDGVDKEAKHYCQDCRQKICDTCRDNHSVLVVTRNHAIIPITKMSAAVSGNQGVAILCGCNKNQQVTYFCETHKELICSPCHSFKHHSCVTSTTKKKSTGYKQTTFDSLLSKSKSLNDRYKQLKKEAKGIDSERKHLKDACKKEIQTFRSELNTFLDNLEKKMDSELDKWERDELRRIKQHVTALTTAIGLLQIDLKLLEDVKNDGRRETMYTADVQVSKTIQGYERRLRELENAGGRPTLTFERNKFLDELKSRVESLGSLITGHLQVSTEMTAASSREKTVLLDRRVQRSSTVNVKVNDDERTPWITGCTMMVSGEFVLCDYENDNVKILNSSVALTRYMRLSSGPWDVSIFDPKSVIVTLPNKEKLKVVQIYPQIKTGKNIRLGKMGWGVEVVKEEIYVTCHNAPGKGEIRVLSLDGKVKRRRNGSFMFVRPQYIIVNQSGEKIFVSDRDRNIVACMSVDGSGTYYIYKDDSLGKPKGLLCDSDDNILVCGGDSNNVQVLTPDGKRYCDLLTYGDRIRIPHSIAYRDSDSTLLAGCKDNNLLSFKLTK